MYLYQSQLIGELDVLSLNLTLLKKGTRENDKENQLFHLFSSEWVNSSEPSKPLSGSVPQAVVQKVGAFAWCARPPPHRITAGVHV